MNNFTFLLSELFDNPVQYKWVSKDQFGWLGEFRIDFEDDYYEYETSIINDDKYGNIIEFELVDTSLEGFTGKNSMDIVNVKGVQYKAFSTVIKMVKEWIRFVEPENLAFSAKEPSRVKLYKRFAKIITDLGYTVNEVKSEKSNTMFMFTKIKRTSRRKRK